MNKNKINLTRFPYIRVTKFLDINDVLELINVSKSIRNAVLNYHKVIKMYLHVFHLLMRYSEDLFNRQNELILTNLKTIFFKNNFKFIRESVNQMLSEFKCNEIKLNNSQIIYVIGNFLAKLILKFKNDLIISDNPYVLKNYFVPHEHFKLLSLNSFDIDDDSVDFLIITLKILKKYGIINGISLCNNKFSNEKIGEILQFASDDYIHLFDFSSNKISIKGIKLIFAKISGYIEKYPYYKISFLDLSDCAILDEELHLISKYLSQNFPIERLCLNANKFNDLKSLATGMKFNSYLRHIRLTQMYLGEDMRPLLEVFRNNEQITNLILDKNNLYPLMPDLINSLSTMKNLTELSLINNKITDEIGEQLIHSLAEGNTNLSLIYLGLNSIGIKSCKQISTFLLSENCKLTVLELQSNQIDDESMKELIKGLQKNKTISLLELGWNKLTKVSGELLADYLKTNKTLNTLNIKQNYLNNEGCSKIIDSISENEESQIKSLNLIGNSIDDKIYSNIKNLVEAKNKSLERVGIQIILDCNVISNEGVEKIEKLNCSSFDIDISLEGMMTDC